MRDLAAISSSKNMKQIPVVILVGFVFSSTTFADSIDELAARIIRKDSIGAYVEGSKGTAFQGDRHQPLSPEDTAVRKAINSKRILGEFMLSSQVSSTMRLCYAIQILRSKLERASDAERAYYNDEIAKLAKGL